MSSEKKQLMSISERVTEMSLETKQNYVMKSNSLKQALKITCIYIGFRGLRRVSFNTIFGIRQREAQNSHSLVS